MAALLPLIQELLPMILPSKVHITKAEELLVPPSTLKDDQDKDNNVEEPAAIREAARLRERHDNGLPTRPQREQQARQSMEKDGEGTSTEWRAGDDETEKREKLRPILERTRHRRRSLFSDDEDEVGEDEAYGEVYDEPQPKARTNGDGEFAARGLDGLSIGPDRRRKPGGVTMRDAIVHKTSSMCASVLTVKPQCATTVFHNGEQESIVYAISGQAVLATLPDDGDDDDDEAAVPAPPTRTLLGPGDFAFVPAWTEHQVINESTDTDVSWVIVHNGAEPTVVPLTEFGGPEAKF